MILKQRHQSIAALPSPIIKTIIKSTNLSIIINIIIHQQKQQQHQHHQQQSNQYINLK